jgi:PIN domain nuclease of toxin-antitoxin system
MTPARAVLDTHTWLWWVSAPGRLGRTARRAVERADTLLLSAISVWEVALKVRRGRLRLTLPLETWLPAALDVPRLELAPLDVAVAVRAAALEGTTLHGDPADRFIVATALERGWPLVTKDEAITAAGVVETVW